MSFTNIMLGNRSHTQENIPYLSIHIKFKIYAKLNCNALMERKNRKVIILVFKIVVISGKREG